MRTENRIRKLLKDEGFVEVFCDVNLSYGGTFIRDCQEYFDVIEVVDLESAAGAGGQILVQAKVTSFEYVRDSRTWQSVFSSMDTRKVLKGIKDKDLRRLVLAYDLQSYGIADPGGYGDGWWVAVLDRIAEKESREKWEKNRVPGWGWAAVMRAVQEAIGVL